MMPRMRRSRRMPPSLVESRRQNVGSPADSEGNWRTANTRKCACAGKKLEAATGVEPVMEVLQTSDCGVAGWWP